MNDLERSIWDGYGRGRSARQIGRELEVSHRTVQNRLNERGGMKPAERRRGVGRLTFGDREEISRSIAAGLSANSIGVADGTASVDDLTNERLQRFARQLAANGNGPGTISDQELLASIANG